MMQLALGSLVAPIEAGFGHVWSVCELGLALTRLDELRGDPYRDALLRDIETRGLHPPLDTVEPLASARSGYVGTRNPYRRLAPHGEERVLAWLQKGEPGPCKTLLLVCHCYGVPVPGVMQGLFGLRRAPVDVAYNILPHHQRGTFSLWPGSGFARVRISSFIENLRSAVTGMRALLRGLTLGGQYERVVVLGFSLGGQVALHVATAETLDSLILYCPVTSLRDTALELGLMRSFAPPLRRGLRLLGRDDVFEDLKVTEPLQYGLRTPEEHVHVVVQRHDALAPPRQTEAIRRRHGGVRWYELGGTHVLPLGLMRLRRVVREAVMPAKGSNEAR